MSFTLTTMAMVGGWSDASAKPSEDQLKILNDLKESIEESFSAKYKVFEAIDVKTQVVAGTNYLFKVKVDNDQIIDVKIHQPLPHTGNPPILMAN